MASAPSKTCAEAGRPDAGNRLALHPAARMSLVALLASLLLILGACAHGPAYTPTPGQQLDRLQQALLDSRRVEPPFEASLPARSPFPPGFAAEQGAWLDPDQHPRSRRSWEEFARSVDLPLFLGDELRPLLADAPVDELLPTEAWPDPPIEAQRLYARARIAVHRREMEQAVGAIRQAVALAPEDPAILAHAGEIEDAVAPGSVRAMDMFRRTLAIDPFQPDVLYLMARRISQQRRWEEVAALLRPAFRLADARGQNTLASLSAYFLAMSLERTGFEQLAAEMYRQSLQRRPVPGEGVRYLREYQLLQQQRARTWQTLGDLELRLGRPGRAWLDYQQALAEIESEPEEDESSSARLIAPDMAALHARMVFALIWLGEHDAAWQTVVNLIERQHSDAASLALARWMGERFAPSAAINLGLKELYDRLDRPRPMLELLADILPQPDVVPLLEAYLDHDPDDRDLFRRWLVIVVTDRQPYLGRVRQDRMPYVCRRVAGWIDRNPARLADYSNDLLAVSWGSGPVLRAIESMHDPERGYPAIQALEGWAGFGGGGYRRAAELLEAAAQADARLVHAVRGAAADRSVLREYSKVIKLLEPLFAEGGSAEDFEPNVDDLSGLAHALKEEGREDDRLELLSRVASWTSAPLVASRGARLLGEHAAYRDQAIQVSLALRKHNPSVGEIHLDLIHLLGLPQDSGVGDRLPDRDAAVQQMLRDAGSSPLVREVQIFFGDLEQGQYERAQRNLRSLVAEFAEERPNLVNLFLMTLFVLDRVDELEEYARALLIEYPFSTELRMAALNALGRVGRREHALELSRRIMEASPPSPRRATAAARLQLEVGRPDLARRLLEPWVNHEMTEQTERAFAQAMVVALGRSRGVDVAEAWLEERLAGTEGQDVRRALREVQLNLLEAAARWDEARAILDHVAAEDPDHESWKLRRLVFLIYAEGDLEEARAFGGSIEVGDRAWMLELLMAQAEIFSGEITAASQRLGQIQHTATHFSVLSQMLMGDIHALSGDSSRALQRYRRALWGVPPAFGLQPLNERYTLQQLTERIQRMEEGLPMDSIELRPWRETHTLPDHRRLMDPFPIEPTPRR